MAPELGHLRLVPDGRACACGKRGCWERYCSGTALVTTVMELLADDPAGSRKLAELAARVSGLTGRLVASAARDGDPLARRAMAELARWLGEGLALVADVYDPELVVLGGGVAGIGPLLFDTVRQTVRERVRMFPVDDIRIERSLLGDRAGLYGGIALARQGGL